MPKILDLHIAFEFVKQMLLAMAVLVLLAVLVHVAQQSAELSRTDATFIDVLGVVFLRLPFLVTEITFLYMFIGGLMALGKTDDINRSDRHKIRRIQWLADHFR